MTDCTWVKVWCRKEDQKAFEEALSMSPHRKPRKGQKYVELHDDEMHPADLNEIPPGLPYIFVHGPSDQGNYGAKEGVADEKRYSHISVDYDGRGYVIMSTKPTIIKAVQAHEEFRDRVKQMMGLKGALIRD